MLRIAFIFPMLVPTASVVVVWRTLFDGSESVWPVYLLFIYKNIGLLIILLSAAFSTLEGDIYEAARLDGAHGFALHRKITLPLISPTLLFTVLIGVVYSFKVFRESYLYFGTSYPPDHSYTLQYYMNNQFLKLNYQSMAAASVMITLLLAGFPEDYDEKAAGKVTKAGANKGIKVEIGKTMYTHADNSHKAFELRCSDISRAV